MTELPRNSDSSRQSINTALSSPSLVMRRKDHCQSTVWPCVANRLMSAVNSRMNSSGLSPFSRMRHDSREQSSSAAVSSATKRNAAALFASSTSTR